MSHSEPLPLLFSPPSLRVKSEHDPYWNRKEELVHFVDQLAESFFLYLFLGQYKGVYYLLGLVENLPSPFALQLIAALFHLKAGEEATRLFFQAELFFQVPAALF